MGLLDLVVGLSSKMIRLSFECCSFDVRCFGMVGAS